ncbi:MAG: DsbA family protein [Armatimonadota bacterium]
MNIKPETKFMLTVAAVVIVLGAVTATINKIASRPPAPPKVAKPAREIFDTSDRPFIGPADAPVVAIQFSDYSCPSCSRGSKLIKELVKQYNPKLKIVFRNLPMTNMHPLAMDLAVAAEAARLQGKFWEMHDMMYANQDDAASNIRKYAKFLGLDMKKFDADRDGEEARVAVAKDMELAGRFGINSTPCYVLFDGNKAGMIYSGNGKFEPALRKLMESK